MIIAQAVLGIAVFLGIAWVMSEDRRSIAWRIVLIGLTSQIALALVFRFVPLFKAFFAALSDGVVAISTATRDGTSFVFGYVGGGDLPFEVLDGQSTFVLGFQSLPLILVIGALSGLLWHWRILIVIVRVTGRVVERAFQVSGAVGVSSAANIFMGMVEAPLLVRPYLAGLTRGELLVVMAGGMSTISGTMLVLYGSILEPHIPGAFGHLLAASVINMPAAILLAKMMVPGEQASQSDAIDLKSTYVSSLDAITGGTIVAIKLLANVIALLIVFITLISLANSALATVPTSGAPITLQGLLGVGMAPFAWLLGIPWEEAKTAGGILGTKIITTEFIAYLELLDLPENALSDRSSLILTYALCSFSNFVSLAILIGGLSAMVPARAKEVVLLGSRSMIAGLMAGAMTACIMGVLEAIAGS